MLRRVVTILLGTKMVKNQTLWVMLPKMSAYWGDFDEIKYMSFLIKYDESLDKCNEIWDKVSKVIKKVLIVSLYTMINI